MIVYAPPQSVDTLPSTPSVRFGDESMAYHVVASIVPLRSGGPDEYMDIGGVVALPGDTLLVWDGIARRATVLTPAGSYVRAFALDAPFEGSDRFVQTVPPEFGGVTSSIGSQSRTRHIGGRCGVPRADAPKRAGG